MSKIQEAIFTQKNYFIPFRSNANTMKRVLTNGNKTATLTYSKTEMCVDAFDGDFWCDERTFVNCKLVITEDGKPITGGENLRPETVKSILLKHNF